jgi:hypothetical protein
MEQQTLPQGAQIASALFQITVGQRGKLFGKFFDDLLNRPLGDRAFIHFGKQLTAQARVGKQVRIEVKDGRRLFLRACGKALAVATKLIRRLFQRGGKALALKRFIKRRGFINLLHQRQRGVHPAFGNRHAWRGRKRANARMAILTKQRGKLGLGEIAAICVASVTRKDSSLSSY